MLNWPPFLALSLAAVCAGVLSFVLWVKLGIFAGMLLAVSLPFVGAMIVVASFPKWED